MKDNTRSAESKSQREVYLKHTLNVGRATAEEVQRSNPKRPHLREAETYKCSKLEKKMPLLI